MIIKIALDEEAKVALEQPKVYENVLKHRITAYKKMKAAEWAKHVESLRSVHAPIKDDIATVETGLSSSEEPLILPYLVADQSQLPQHGYIIKPVGVPSKGSGRISPCGTKP